MKKNSLLIAVIIFALSGAMSFAVGITEVADSPRVAICWGVFLLIVSSFGLGVEFACRSFEK